MIIKLLINKNNKLIYNKFFLKNIDNKIIIYNINNNKNISDDKLKENINLSEYSNEPINNDYYNENILIPIYNIYNCITYYPIIFPLELLIYNNKLFNPYIILSSFNNSDLEIENDIDFFNQIKKIIFNSYNIVFYNFNYFINDKHLELIKILELYNLNDPNIIKLYIIYIILINNNKIINKLKNKNVLNIYNIIINFKYDLSIDNNLCNNILNNYYNNYYNNLNLNDLIINNYYFIVNNFYKFSKIYINNINNNIITINNNDEINFENYKWHNYYPLINVTKDYVIFQTYINNKFNDKILELNNLIKYNLNKINYNINLQIDNQELLFNINDLIKSNFDKSIFKNMVLKFSNDTNNFYKILNFLFINYNYPLKINRHDIDNIFDFILYISLYNYNIIFNDDILNLNISNIVPIKVKNLYINVLKTLIQIINNNYELITFNQKFYIDYLHKNIIFLIFTKSDNLFINFFIEKISNESFIKFKNIVFNNYILLDISNKLNWNNLSKKLPYLDFFYKNKNLIFYQSKVNKIIFNDNFDSKIKKIIENPFEMYKFLKKEIDFIKWTYFIHDNIINIYFIPISLSYEDYKLIGKIIYLLFMIEDQNITDKSYIHFLNFSNLNNKIILNNNRINIKIKEYFSNIKCNINLGILAKHLTWNKDIITFDNINNIDEIKKLENKIDILNKKYIKYKNKYIKYKNNFIFDILN
jgi:hypothetical protein